MKIRNGFVSNSSSSSFICNICNRYVEVVGDYEPNTCRKCVLVGVSKLQELENEDMNLKYTLRNLTKEEKFDLFMDISTVVLESVPSITVTREYKNEN